MILRKSKKRDSILELVKSVTSHPTAEWIYLTLKPKMPELSLATVYRNLDQLVSQGLLRKIEGDDGLTHFDGNTLPHYHLTCNCCNRICDIKIDYVENLAKEMAKETRFQITGYNMNFYGVCPECQ